MILAAVVHALSVAASQSRCLVNFVAPQAGLLSLGVSLSPAEARSSHRAFFQRIHCCCLLNFHDVDARVMYTCTYYILSSFIIGRHLEKQIEQQMLDCALSATSGPHCGPSFLIALLSLSFLQLKEL